jgi:hypothetical protein
MVVAALGALTEETLGEVTGKLKEKLSEEGPMWAFFFCPIFVSSNPDFHTLLLKG